MRLSELGPRICIMGPSGSGKSSLACAIARQQGMPARHLDQLRHLPDTDWQLRPFDEFAALHEAAIKEDRWVMDGNYSACLPQRLARATGLVVLDVSMGVSLVRYLRRCAATRPRAGGLAGSTDRVKWSMIRHIVWTTPGHRRRYRHLSDSLALPRLRLEGRAAINDFYRREGLDRG